METMSEMSISAPTKLISPELDWSAKKLSHSSIQYSKIAVINGVNTGTLTTASQGAFSFQIPAKVLSLKDSYVSLDLAIGTAGAGGNQAVLQGNLSNIFSRIVITADNNTVLADINDFHRFSAMLTAPSMKLETLQQECISGQSVLFSDDIPTARRSPFNVLQKNSNFIITDAATVQAPLGGSKVPVDVFTNGTTALHQENLNLNSARHYIQSTLAATATTHASYQFRLKDLLPHTICALDQLLYFGGSQLQFDFYLNNVDFVGYLSATSTIQNSAIQGALPATTFSNFQFNLATESNVNLINTVMSKVRDEGIRIPIPYVYGAKNTITASTSHSVNQVITRTAGKSLLWVAYAPFTNGGARDINNAHTIITASAVTGQPVYTINFSSYNTSLDNIFIKSQSTIDCSRGEHWLYNKRELAGSALQGLEAHTNDFVHIDSWIGKPLCEYDPSVEDGLVLNENHTWGLTATTANLAYDHHIYYCAQRELVIQPFSVQIV
jgi:hypothetical protein